MREVVFLYGVSGSGKSTQSKLLHSYLSKTYNKKVHSISTGKILREIFSADKNTALSHYVNKEISSGNLLITPPVISAILYYLKQYVYKGDLLVFDGAGRREEEIQLLKPLFEFCEYGSPAIITIDVSEEDVLQRLTQRGRSDDNVIGIKKRIAWYKKEVQEALRIWDGGGAHTAVVNGAGTPDEIHARILEHI